MRFLAVRSVEQEYVQHMCIAATQTALRHHTAPTNQLQGTLPE